MTILQTLTKTPPLAGTGLLSLKRGRKPQVEAAAVAAARARQQQTQTGMRGQQEILGLLQRGRQRTASTQALQQSAQSIGLSSAMTSLALLKFQKDAGKQPGIAFSPAPPAGTPALDTMLQVAKRQVGDNYVFGAEGPDSFDCSGLVYFSAQRAGLNIPRMSARGYQSAYGGVPRKALQPGDLIFYWYTNSRGIPKGQASHVEIYLGNGMSVGADDPREGVRIEPVNWSAFVGGGRLPGGS